MDKIDWICVFVWLIAIPLIAAVAYIGMYTILKWLIGV